MRQLFALRKIGQEISDPALVYLPVSRFAHSHRVLLTIPNLSRELQDKNVGDQNAAGTRCVPTVPCKQHTCHPIFMHKSCAAAIASKPCDR